MNLQCASTVLITDFWWNSGKTKQSVARINRYGQLAKKINVYYFTSNTGIEKALFEKHGDKIKVSEELMVGQQKSNIKPMTMNQILNLIDSDSYMEKFRSTI